MIHHGDDYDGIGSENSGESKHNVISKWLLNNEIGREREQVQFY